MWKIHWFESGTIYVWSNNAEAELEFGYKKEEHYLKLFQ